MAEQFSCTAPVGRRCAGCWDNEDVAAGGRAPGDWLCKSRRRPAEWIGSPSDHRSLAADAALAGADVHDAARVAAHHRAAGAR